MATITVDTFLDGGTARTAGEAWTCNGGRLTIRTDSRWHANMPATMTGTLGSVTISSSLGGGYTIDGTKVRWLAYTGGSGTVPAIGTTITQGGVSGYLLGVWATVIAAPTAAAAAMPASGFIKFREVTGTFAAGALTGITATASGADVVGWIEVVHDQAASITVPRIGDFTVRGKWFDLGTTTGIANQLIDVPMNGSATGYTPGVFIDDAAIAISAASWSGGIATFTATGHGFTNTTRGSQIRHAFISGISPSGYNFADGIDITVTGPNTFTVPLLSDPGSYVSGGTVNTNTYYPAVFAGGMIATNFGTDIRSQVVCMETTGQIRIGHNGTAAVGYIPPAGRKIRIQNVFGRQCTTAARATNVLPSATYTTRPDFVTTNAGVIDIEGFSSDWYHNYLQCYSSRHVNFSTFETIGIAECATYIITRNGGLSTTASISITSPMVSCFAGGEISDFKYDRYNATNNSAGLSLTNCNDFNFTRCTGGIQTYARLGASVAFIFSQCVGINLYDCSIYNMGITFTTCVSCKVDGLDYCDRYVGTTNTTTGQNAIVISGFCDTISCRNITFGKNGTIANVQPYTGLFIVTQSKNIKLRECGTRSAMINAGTVNAMGYIFTSGGNNVNIRLQRLYFVNTRGGAISPNNSDSKMLCEHVYGDFADALILGTQRSYYKGVAGAYSTTGQASVYGSQFWHGWFSDTVGRIVLSFNEAYDDALKLSQKIAGNPKFTSVGNLVLSSVGDEVIIEQDYYVLGITALSNAAPVITGTNVTWSAGSRWGNHDIYYQIDKGTGFGGTWINFTQANLALETGINPAIGFRLKYRFVCAIASTTNLLTYMKIDCVTTLADQRDNLYPLDTSILELTGLIAGSEVRVYTGTDPSTAVQISGTDSSGTTYSFTHAQGGVSGYIVVFALGYQPVNLPITYTSSDISIPIQQTVDRVYENV